MITMYGYFGFTEGACVRVLSRLVRVTENRLGTRTMEWVSGGKAPCTAPFDKFMRSDFVRCDIADDVRRRTPNPSRRGPPVPK